MINEKELKLVKKYQRLAEKASFNNFFIQKIKNADLTKDLYENHITCGTGIDGQCMKLKTIEKYCGHFTMNMFRESVRDRTYFNSERFKLYGYDGTLWCEPRENGEVLAGLCKEFTGTGNGYYYLLINDETFIGYDVD